MNETEALVKRATRGAGYPWGLAEEAGKAVVWLSKQNIDGCTAIVTLLQLGFAKLLWQHSPKDLKFCGQSVHELCPLVTGAAFSDGVKMVPNQGYQFGRVAVPVMLLAFVASVALRENQTFVIEYNCGLAMTDGVNLHVINNISYSTSSINISKTDTKCAINCKNNRALLKPDTLEVLNQLAQQTYAPATDQSRKAGAGSGELTDNE